MGCLSEDLSPEDFFPVVSLSLLDDDEFPLFDFCFDCFEGDDDDDAL